MPQPLTIQAFDTPETCAHFLGTEISTCLAQRKGRPTLLLLSGGSALAVLDSIKIDDWTPVTITLLDERFEPDEAHNNFRALEQTPWYTRVRTAGGTFISTRIQAADTRDTVAERLEQKLHEWMHHHANGQMIALFGMGADGHTAGIFPFPEDPASSKQWFSGDRLVVAYDASDKNALAERVTTTHTLHQQIAHAFVYITGEDKRAALANVLQNTATLPELPAQIFHMLPDVTLATTLHP